ncbi:MAG TPA: PP2C family protein-serine/threonine phosphatase [Nitrolancea sp.]|nr:PP2C family protein-serine/threonine phosphatase [Nitrolancea sp.]
MPVTIDLAVAKTHKSASRQSGDTVELVERPAGGFSVVVVDGQGSGAPAKSLSLRLAGHATRLLNEGVRDGAAARAIHDFLFALRSGRVSAALDIISVDLSTSSVLFTRNSEVPMLLRQNGQFELIQESAGRIGVYRHTRPRVLEYPATPGLLAILVTDGVIGAGARWGTRFDLLGEVESIVRPEATAEQIASGLLQAAMDADHGRPQDDMSVVVLLLGPAVSSQPVRRLAVSIPLIG